MPEGKPEPEVKPEPEGKPEPELEGPAAPAKETPATEVPEDNEEKYAEKSEIDAKVVDAAEKVAAAEEKKEEEGTAAVEAEAEDPAKEPEEPTGANDAGNKPEETKTASAAAAAAAAAEGVRRRGRETEERGRVTREIDFIRRWRANGQGSGHGVIGKQRYHYTPPPFARFAPILVALCSAR